jgi:trigger factor
VTLTIHTEQDDQRQLKMTVEVAEERVGKQMRQTARKLGRDVNIPGFRRGKVPYNVLVKRLGAEMIRAEAIEDLLQPVFEEAMAEVDPDIYAQAQFDDMEMEPLVLKFTIPLNPVIELGDYRELREEIETVEVTDEAVAEALEHARTHHQQLEDVDRGAEAGDMVTLSGRGVLVKDEGAEEEGDSAPEQEAEEDAAAEAADDTDESELTEEAADEILAAAQEQVIFQEESVELVMDAEKVFARTDFVQNVLGLTAGEEKSFTITFPEEYDDEELAGKEAAFEISVLNVQNRILPDLDDELAKLEGDYETLEDLTTATRERLQEQAENEAKNARIEKMIDDLLEDATLTYPPAAVEQEIDDMMENFKSQVTRSGWQWEDFVKIQGMDEAQLRENFRENAAERLERQLVLRQFVLDEKLTVTMEDIDGMIDERVGSFGDNEELIAGMRDYYRSGPGFDMLSSEVLMEKAYDRMVAILSGEAPDLAELEAELAAASDEADETEEAVDEAAGEEESTTASDAVEDAPAEAEEPAAESAEAEEPAEADEEAPAE